MLNRYRNGLETQYREYDNLYWLDERGHVCGEIPWKATYEPWKPTPLEAGIFGRGAAERGLAEMRERNRARRDLLNKLSDEG